MISRSQQSVERRRGRGDIPDVTWIKHKRMPSKLKESAKMKLNTDSYSNRPRGFSLSESFSYFNLLIFFSLLMLTRTEFMFPAPSSSSILDWTLSKVPAVFCSQLNKVHRCLQLSSRVLCSTWQANQIKLNLQLDSFSSKQQKSKTEVVVRVPSFCFSTFFFQWARLFFVWICTDELVAWAPGLVRAQL